MKISLEKVTRNFYFLEIEEPKQLKERLLSDKEPSIDSEKSVSGLSMKLKLAGVRLPNDYPENQNFSVKSNISAKKEFVSNFKNSEKCKSFELKSENEGITNVKNIKLFEMNSKNEIHNDRLDSPHEKLNKVTHINNSFYNNCSTSQNNENIIELNEALINNVEGKNKKNDEVEV